MKKLIPPILMLMPLIVSAATYEKVLNVFTGKFDYVNGKVSTSTYRMEVSTSMSAPNGYFTNIQLSTAANRTSITALEKSTGTSTVDIACRISTGTLAGLSVFFSSMTELQRIDNSKLNASSGPLVVPYTVFYGSMTEVELVIRNLILGATGVTYTDFYGSMTVIEGQYTNNSVFLDSMTKIDANFTPVSVFLASMTAVDANFTSNGVFFGSMTIIEGQYLSKSVFFTSMTNVQNDYVLKATFFSSMTESERIDATKIDISSVAIFEGLINARIDMSSVAVFEGLINGRLPASSGTTTADLIAGKLPASSGTVIALSLQNSESRYSTTTISLVMVDTVTAGNLIGMYMPAVRIPFDCILKNAHIAIFDAAGAFVNGSATVLVSTASPGGTFGPCFTISTATASQGDYAPPTGTIDGIIPIGSYIRGAVTVFGTGYGLSVGVDVWKR